MLLSCAVLLFVNVVGYVVLADLELSVKADIILRHGELAVCNSCVFRLPALKGIAFLRGNRRTYVYIIADSVLLSCVDLLLTVNVIGYVELILNPLCIQIQFGHQNSSRIRKFKFVGACLVGIPAAKGVTLRSFEHPIVMNVTNSIGVATRLVIYESGIDLARDSIIGIVGIISDINRNALKIAVNMDILYPTPILPFALVLNGIPYNSNIIRIELESRGIKQSLSCILTGIGVNARVVDSAIRIPVARSEETEIVRDIQILSRNAIFDVSDRAIPCLFQCLHTCFGHKTFVTSRRIQTLYATVAADDIFFGIIAARQVVFLVLVTVVIRLTTLRQKHEILGFLPPILWEADLKRLRADFIFRRVAYYIIILRIVFRTFGNGGISAIASLRAVRTAVCFVVRRSRCGILILGRLCLGLRRSGNSGSFGGVCCGNGIIYRYCDFFVRRKKCDVLIVGQRPARAHGQHHDSRKCSCEQTFARILFKHMECLLSQRAC